MNHLKVYEIYHKPTQITCYREAETASKARYKAYLSAHDAGYDPEFKEFVVRRYYGAVMPRYSQTVYS